MLRIGISGSKGFLGKNLVNAFNYKKYKVIDITREDFKNLNKKKLDVLFHLGTNVPFADYEYTKERQLEDINNIIAIAKSNIKKVIYASGLMIYTERTPYAECKVISEKILLLGKPKATILRFPAIYGPGQRKVGFIHSIVNKKFDYRKITKDYMYIDEAIYQLLHAIELNDIVYDIKSKFISLEKGIRLYKESLRKPIYLDLDGTLVKAKKFNGNKVSEKDYINEKSLFPYTIETLKKLKKDHCLILITKRRDKNVLLQQLTNLGIIDYFTWITACGDDSKTKYILFNNAIIVGDTEDDILAGKENNIPTFAVLSGLRTKKQLKALKPNYIINDIREVSKYDKR